jgi:hypothetical protein
MNTCKSLCEMVLLVFLCALGCQEQKNPVLDYFEGVEIQCENDSQRENIKIALNDILILAEEDLRSKRYADYSGKENQWDLPTLILRHFVPDRKGKSLGDNFYKDVKSEEVQKIIRSFLEKLQ